MAGKPLGRIGVVVALALALASSGQRSEANILSLLGKLGSTAGRVSATAGKLSSGLSHVGAAATYLKALPLKSGVAALAAVAEDSGGWRFVSAAGDDVVANSASDVARLLERETAAGKALDLYLPPSALAGEPAMLDQVFEHASVNIVGRSGTTYPVHRVASADGHVFDVALRDNVVARVDQPAVLEEILGRAERGFNASSVHVLSMDQAGAEALSGVPRWSDEARLPLAQMLDPAHLGEDFRLIRGHTAIVTGRIDGAVLSVRRGSSDVAIRMADLDQAARDADINLIVLSTDTTAQPGARGLLGGRVAVDNLADAMASQTWSDFLGTLAGKDAQLLMSANPSGRTHVAIDVSRPAPAARPAADSSAGSPPLHVLLHGVKIFARDQDHEDAQDEDIIAGVPGSLGLVVLINLVLGAVAWDMANLLLLRVWPRALVRREATGSRWARAVRLGTMVLILLPLFGYGIFLAWLARLVWRAVTAPFRWLVRARAG